MSDSHSSIKRIPISQLHEFDPREDQDSYLLVCNNASTGTTGVVCAKNLISDYLSDVLSGSDDFQGLTDYISHHGGGGGGGNLPDMIQSLYSRHEPVNILDDELVVYHSTSSTFRIEINDLVLHYLDHAIVDAGNSWQNFTHWIYYTFQSYSGGDTSHLYKVLANEYLDYQMYHYFDDLEELDPIYYSAGLKMPIYGVEDNDNEDTLHYISLGDLAEYIKNYTPPL